jgi:hypothetical protein
VTFTEAKHGTETVLTFGAVWNCTLKYIECINDPHIATEVSIQYM